MRLYFAFVGIVVLGIACWLFLRRLTIFATGVTTTGRIESYQSSEFDGSVGYFPVVSFTDHLGNQQRFTSSAGGSNRTPPVGTAVKVRYVRDNPKTAFITSFLHMWTAPIALAVLGIGSLLAYRVP